MASKASIPCSALLLLSPLWCSSALHVSSLAHSQPHLHASNNAKNIVFEKSADSH